MVVKAQPIDDPASTIGAVFGATEAEDDGVAGLDSEFLTHFELLRPPLALHEIRIESVDARIANGRRLSC